MGVTGSKKSVYSEHGSVLLETSIFLLGSVGAGQSMLRLRLQHHFGLPVARKTHITKSPFEVMTLLDCWFNWLSSNSSLFQTVFPLSEETRSIAELLGGSLVSSTRFKDEDRLLLKKVVNGPFCRTRDAWIESWDWTEITRGRCFSLNLALLPETKLDRLLSLDPEEFSVEEQMMVHPCFGDARYHRVEMKQITRDEKGNENGIYWNVVDVKGDHLLGLRERDGAAVVILNLVRDIADLPGFQRSLDLWNVVNTCRRVLVLGSNYDTLIRLWQMPRFRHYLEERAPPKALACPSSFARWMTHHVICSVADRIPHGCGPTCIVAMPGVSLFAPTEMWLHDVVTLLQSWQESGTTAPSTTSILPVLRNWTAESSISHQNGCQVVLLSCSKRSYQVGLTLMAIRRYSWKRGPSELLGPSFPVDVIRIIYGHLPIDSPWQGPLTFTSKEAK